MLHESLSLATLTPHSMCETKREKWIVRNGKWEMKSEKRKWETKVRHNSMSWVSWLTTKGRKGTTLKRVQSECDKGVNKLGLTSWAFGLGLSCSLSLGLLPCLAWPRSSRPRKARRGKADRGRSRIPPPGYSRVVTGVVIWPKIRTKAWSRFGIKNSVDLISEVRSDHSSDAFPVTHKCWMVPASPRGHTRSTAHTSCILMNSKKGFWSLVAATFPTLSENICNYSQMCPLSGIHRCNHLPAGFREFVNLSVVIYLFCPPGPLLSLHRFFPSVWCLSLPPVQPDQLSVLGGRVAPGKSAADCTIDWGPASLTPADDWWAHVTPSRICVTVSSLSSFPEMFSFHLDHSVQTLFLRSRKKPSDPRSTKTDLFPHIFSYCHSHSHDQVCSLTAHCTVVHSLPKGRLWKESYMDQVSNNFADLDTSIPSNFMTSIN